MNNLNIYDENIDQNILSSGEIDFIKEGITKNIRLDGRKYNEYRQFTLESNIIPSAYASAKLIASDTEIIVTIKAEIIDEEDQEESIDQFKKQENSNPKNSNSNRIHCNIQSVINEDYTILSNELTSIYSNIFNFKNTTTNMLEIIKNKFYWHIYIDVLIINHNGNLLSYSSLTIYKALLKLSLPAISISSGEKTNEKIIELDNIKANIKPFDNNYNHIPICISIIKIDQYLLIDPNIKEEICSLLQFNISINQNNIINFISKEKFSGINIQTIKDILTLIQKISPNIFKKLLT